jgi:hypothetical protein
MPNNWNNIIPGITQGLQNLGAGFIQKADRNDAQKLYEGIGGSYDKINQLRDKAIDVVQNNGAINQPEYQKDGVITGDTMPVRPQTQEDPNELIGNLYKDIVKKTGQLNQNPYGKDYSNLIDKFYGQNRTKYDIVSSKNGTMYAIDPYNPSKKITIEEATPKTEKWAQVPGSKSFTSEEDGKYYVTQMKQSADGETKLVKTELNKEDYESWKKYNPTYEDRQDILQENRKDFVSFKLDLGLGNGKSGKKGSGKEVLSTLDKDKKAELLKYAKDSDDFNKTQFESDYEKQKAYDKLKATRERLAKDIPIEDIDRVKEDHIAGKLTDKEVTRTTKSGRDYTVQIQKQKSQIETKFKEQLTKFQSGQITIDVLKQWVMKFFESNQDRLLPEIKSQVEEQLKQYGLL